MQYVLSTSDDLITKLHITVLAALLYVPYHECDATYYRDVGASTRPPICVIVLFADLLGLDHPLARHGAFDTEAAAVSFLTSKLGIPEDAIALLTDAQWGAGRLTEAADCLSFPLSVSTGTATVTNHWGGIMMESPWLLTSPSTTTARYVHVVVSIIKLLAKSVTKAALQTLDDAITTAEKTLDSVHNGPPVMLDLFVQLDGFAVLSHVIQIRNDSAETWYKALDVENKLAFCDGLRREGLGLEHLDPPILEFSFSFPGSDRISRRLARPP